MPTQAVVRPRLVHPNVFRPETKWCPKCVKEKTRAEFATVRASRTGLAGWCRACCNEGMLALRRSDPLGGMLIATRSAAKKRGVEFTITREHLVLHTHCPLLGIKLKNGVGSGRPLDSSPTIDRLENDLGYVPGNVWVVSHKANRIKNNSTIQEMELVLTNWKMYLLRRSS